MKSYTCQMFINESSQIVDIELQVMKNHTVCVCAVCVCAVCVCAVCVSGGSKCRRVGSIKCTQAVPFCCHLELWKSQNFLGSSAPTKVTLRLNSNTTSW